MFADDLFHLLREPSQHAQRCGVEQLRMPLDADATFQLGMLDALDDSIWGGGGDLERSGVANGLMVG